MKRHFVSVVSGLTILIAMFITFGLGATPQKQLLLIKLQLILLFHHSNLPIAIINTLVLILIYCMPFAKDQGFKVNIKPTSFNSAVQSVQSGQADGVIAGMSITKEREATLIFKTLLHVWCCHGSET